MSARTSFTTALLIAAFVLPGVSPSAAQTSDCPGAPASIVSDQNGDAMPVASPQALRSEPGKNAPVVGEVPLNGIVNVLNQTACIDGTLWRKLVYQGVVGFAPEFVSGEPTFAPYTPPEPIDVSISGRRITQIKSDALVGEHSTALASGFLLQPQVGYSFPSAMSVTPHYLLFEAEDYIVQGRDAYIVLYPVEAWRALSSGTGERIDALQAQLDSRPTLPLMDANTGLRAPLIDLPYRHAAQLTRASQRYIDFDNGSGIRFISYYAQMTGELNDHFFYTFNGITDDGRTYISADLPISLPPGTLPAFDYAANLAAGEEPMNSYYVQYLEQVNLAIETLEPYQTLPSLQTLDDLMTSLYVGDARWEP